MTQYCRYCCHALDYNGEGTDFICHAKAKCGNNGAGKFYSAAKAKRPNKCRSFEFNKNDVFDLDKKYQPRQSEPAVANSAIVEQMKLDFVGGLLNG